MLREYIRLIKVILLVLVVSGSMYFGYNYSENKWEAKESAELVEVKNKLAQLEKEKQVIDLMKNHLLSIEILQQWL